METSKFIFRIDAEKHYNVLVRIVTTFNRLRIPVLEFSSHSKHGDDIIRVTIGFEESRENAVKLSKKLDREVDIIEVNLFEECSA